MKTISELLQAGITQLCEDELKEIKRIVDKEIEGRERVKCYEEYDPAIHEHYDYDLYNYYQAYRCSDEDDRWDDE